jgi:predicted acyl esterase
MHHPAHAAMVPMSAGAGIGKVGRFQEQGNLYTGGVPRNLFAVWLYGGRTGETEKNVR